MKTLGYYSNPALAESVVQTLRQSFDTNLEWLDNSYPIVCVGVEEQETFPIVWAGVKDHISLRPDDSVDSYCFFEFYSAQPGDDNDPVTYNLGVIFWVDLDKLDTSQTEDYTWNLISDVCRILKKNEAYKLDISTDDVFDNYTFELDKQQLMRKYSGFKIMFTIFGDNNMCDFG